MTDNAFPSLDLKQVLSGTQLPALPQSAIRLLELSQDPNNGPADFAIPIEADPGLTGQVLRFVNSSYFGFAREISSIRLAITLVGIRTIKNFALWSAVFSLMPNPRCGPFDLKCLWQDSLRRALFARTIGKVLGMSEAEEPFAAALLQDMAIPLLAKEAPEAYVRLLEARQQGRVRLSELENRAFGWNHAQAAGLIVRNWNLPEAFAILIENHLDVEFWTAQARTEPAHAAVALSSLLPSVKDNAWLDCHEFERRYEAVCPAGSPTALQMLGEVDQSYVEFAPVLKLGTPGKSLLESYAEVAASAP